MNDMRKTKDELIRELRSLRRKVTALEKGKETKGGFAEKISARKKPTPESEHFGDFLEDSPLPYQSLDKNGIILAINQIWLDTLGYKRKEVVGRHFNEFLAPEYRDKFRECFRDFKQKNMTSNIEMEMVQKNGMRKVLSFYGKIKRNEKGDFLMTHCIFQDISERKRVEEELHDSEKKYRLLFENLQEGIWTIDQDACTTFVNARMAEMLGYTANEMQGRHLFSFMDEYGVKIAKVNLKRRKGGIKEQHEFEFLRKDGTRIYAFMATSPIFNDDGKYIGAIAGVLDITNLKRTHETLRQERDRAQKYLDIAGVMFIAINSEEEVMLINRKGCEVLGYRQEEIIGKNWFDNFFPGSVKDQVKTFFHRLMAGEIKPVEYHENPVLTKGGEERIISWHNTVLKDGEGNIIGALGSGEDITERKDMEEALKKSYDELRLILDATTEGIWQCDFMKNTLYFSEQWYAMLGYEPFEFPASYENWEALLHPADREQALAVAEKYLETKPDTYENEFRLRTKDGQYRWIIANAKVVERNGNGEAVRLIGNHRDITERKEGEKKLKQYRDRLGELASEMAIFDENERKRFADELHDVIGQNLALSKIKIAELRDSVIDAGLKDRFNELGELINNVSQSIRALTFELSPPILYEIGFEAAAEWLGEQILNRYNIAFYFHDDMQPKPLMNDTKILLYLSLRELIVNIAKHANARNATLAIRREGRNIHVSVSDDGIGFNTAELDYQIMKAKTFGLFSTRERLERLGGRLEIASQPGKGTTVTMVAPLKE